MFAENLQIETQQFQNHIQMINENLTSSMFEVDTEYFHVVDESRLFLSNLMPLKGVRFKHKGLKIILNKMSEVFNKQINLTTFKIELERYNLCGSEMEDVLSKNDNFYKQLHFKGLKKNELGAILINVVNKNEKLMHASALVYGIDEKNEKYIILIDPYFYAFADIIDQNCFISSLVKYFYKKIKSVNIFAQPDKIQRDSNSCSTISLEMIRQFCANSALAAEITSQRSKENLRTFTDQNKQIFFYKYKLPQSFKKFKQKLSDDESLITLSEADFNTQNYNNKYHKNLLINEWKVKTSAQFNSNNTIYDNFEYLKYKKINVFFLMKSYEYARLLLLLIKQGSKKNNSSNQVLDLKTQKPMQFNPKYWIDLLRDPEGIKFDKRKIFKVKKFTEDQLALDLLIQQEEKITIA